MEEFRNELSALQDEVRALSKRIPEPMSMRVVVAIIGSCLSVVFAAGMWANSTHQSISAVEVSIGDMRGAIARLNTIDLLQSQISTLQAEVQRLRDREEGYRRSLTR